MGRMFDDAYRPSTAKKWRYFVSPSNPFFGKTFNINCLGNLSLLALILLFSIRAIFSRQHNIGIITNDTVKGE